MHIPLGLDPVNIRRQAQSIFTLREASADYLVFEANGRDFVFYKGFPELEVVFESAKRVHQLYEKQEMAESLIGQRFMIEQHPTLRYRESVSDYTDKYFENVKGELEITIKDVVVSYDQLLLGFGDEETHYLVMDTQSEYALYELECLEEQDMLSWDLNGAQHREDDKQINQILQSRSNPVDLLKDEWLAETLRNRFRYKFNRQLDEEYYLCRYLSSDQLEKGNYIIAWVDKNGVPLLHSQYISSKGLYHTRVEVFIGGETYTSERIATLDNRNKRTRTRGKVVEQLHFGENGDLGIIEMIARNADQPITVRFTAGGSYYEDIALEDTYKIAIRDSWLFAILMQQDGQTGARIRGRKD